jgi:hypothetical protein
MKIFDPEYKEETVRLFIQNLLWGKVSIDYMRFGSKQEGLKFAKELNEKVNYWQNHMFLCDDEDPQYFAGVQDWIYNAIHECRAYGALVGELHDKTDEDRIKELEQEVEKWKANFESVKSDAIILANELNNTRSELQDTKHIIDSYERGIFKNKEGDNKP